MSEQGVRYNVRRLVTRAVGVMCPGDGALTATSVLADTMVGWIIRQSRHIMPEACSKKLSGESAEREVSDTAAPTYSTASRGLFATLGESSRYFNHPKTYNTHKPKIRATLALVVHVPPRPAPPVSSRG